MCLTQKVVTDGGLEYAKTVLEKAFGESVAHGLLERVSKQLKTRAFAKIMLFTSSFAPFNANTRSLLSQSRTKRWIERLSIVVI